MGVGWRAPMLVTLPDGREACVSLHARERARERIGDGWLGRLMAALRVPRWPNADAYVDPDGATFVVVDGAGDGAEVVTAYVGSPLLVEVP